jgi:hypothetical protein
MWTAFKVTLGIVLGLLAVPVILALIVAARISQ